MKISKTKIDRLKEQILAVLYRNWPKPMFTASLSSELIRDEEFIKRLLSELEMQRLVVGVKKNNNGIDYLRRIRWRLSNRAYEAYKKISKPLEYDEKEHTFSYA